MNLFPWVVAGFGTVASLFLLVSTFTKKAKLRDSRSDRVISRCLAVTILLLCVAVLVLARAADIELKAIEKQEQAIARFEKREDINDVFVQGDKVFFTRGWKECKATYELTDGEYKFTSAPECYIQTKTPVPFND